MTFAQPFTDYEILDRVGAGAMGTVFKARHKKLGRIVALKVLKPSLARDSRYVDRLKREARIVASLNHAHIVTGYDLGEEGGYHFFVMEFVEGKSLRALLGEWGMFAEEYVLDIGIQIAEALDHAYQRGVIHRDIKPGNVLIDEDGDVKLTDMGLAKGPADLTLTRDGATVGTPQYISPEQARSPQDVDVRSDLYSLGATLYHMATGVPPFTGETMAELIGKVIYDAPTPPDELNPALTSGLSLVLRKLLAKDLRIRYQTPRELLDDLQRVKQAQPPDVDAARLAAGEGERRTRLPLRVFLVAAAALVVIGAAVWLGTQLRTAPPTAVEGDSFLEELEVQLAAEPTPGRRWQRVRAVAQSAPSGMGLELLRLENRAFHELEVAFDGAVARLTGEGWVEFKRRARDPTVWPGRVDCERTYLARALHDATGLEESMLPSMFATRLSELRVVIGDELAQRDAGFLRRLDEFLVKTLAELVDERLRAYDFAGAARLWDGALADFCDGVHWPRVEQLGEGTERAARERCAEGQLLALPRIEEAETRVARVMKEHVEAVVDDLARQLAPGQAGEDTAGGGMRDPEDVAEDVAAFREELLQVWPASARFRAERDPWPYIDGRLRWLQQRTTTAVAAAAARRVDRRFDLAWRALCHGDVDDALAVLEDAEPPTDELRAELDGHRRALRAAAAVHEGMLTALVRARVPVLAFPRVGSGLAVRVFAESTGGRPELYCEAGGGTRRATASEFRFSELVDALRKAGEDPLTALPPEEAARGVAVLRLVGDDFAGFGELARALEDPFLLDRVAPRIRRVRDESSEIILDRQGLLEQLQLSLQGARAGGELRELERAIQTFRSKVPELERTPTERRELRAAWTWWDLARRRDAVREEVAASAPQGARVEVGIDEEVGEVTAEVAVQAPQLLRGTSEGWQLRDGMLEFAGGDRPWSEIEVQRLVCETGIPVVGAGRSRSVLQLDFVVPPARVGGRFYVIEFRGVAVMLVITANDAVHAALVDGDPRREDLADQAFDRAMRGVLEAPKAVVVPGAVHRLTVDVMASTFRTRAAVRVLLEGRELMAAKSDLESERPVALVLYPRQEMRVQQVAVRGSGL